MRDRQGHRFNELKSQPVFVHPENGRANQYCPSLGTPKRKSSCLFLHATGRTLGRVFRLPVGANLREQTRGKDQ